MRILEVGISLGGGEGGGKTGLGLCVEEGVGGFQSPREVGIE